ncbi:hypothetical protein OROHE_026684 [Orobanche hederae]
MRISTHCYRTQDLFRYCCTLPSPFSCKTLNPQIVHSAVPLISKSTICYYLHNSSSGPVSKRSSNPYLPIESHFSIKPPSWLSSRYEIDPYFRHKHQNLRHFSSGRPKIRASSHSLLNYLHSPTLLKRDSYYIHRRFTVLSSNGRIVSGPAVDTVAGISSDQQKSDKRNNFVLEIVDIIRTNGEDLESRLNMSFSRLSVYSITEIFKVLNTRRIFGLRFFEWIWSKDQRLHKNANVCSLIIDNFGRLDDYKTMFAWLKTFTSEKICLTHEAFFFLPILTPANSSLNDSTQRVVDLLNEVGGSCRNSGVIALIEMFCKLDLFEMARYVIKITESKKSYYCCLVRGKCKNGLIEDAYNIIREMQESHCAPNTTMYNYILGSLWKHGKTDEAFALRNEMNAIGISADEVTFEILINFVCKLGKLDDVRKMLDEMVSQGLEPRPTTHARIIKSLFAAEEYEAAHKHVVHWRYKTSGNMIYSLMANLYWEKGDIMSARGVLVEMMGKCLKPNFSIYIKIVKQLRRTGRANIARDLESTHAKFVIKSRA